MTRSFGGDMSIVSTNKMSILDVWEGMQNDEYREFHNMKVHIVSYHAQWDFPFKFLYIGCNKCNVSTKGGTQNRCPHDALGKDGQSSKYRFEFVLRDCTHNVGLNVCVWDEVAIPLLGMSADIFSLLEEAEQKHRINELTRVNPLCNVKIRISKQKAHLDEVEILEASTVLNSSPLKTPKSPPKSTQWRTQDTYRISQPLSLSPVKKEDGNIKKEAEA